MTLKYSQGDLASSSDQAFMDKLSNDSISADEKAVNEEVW